MNTLRGLKIVLFRANLSWPCTHAIMGGKIQISAREQFSIVINMAEKNLTERTEEQTEHRSDGYK